MPSTGASSQSGGQSDSLGLHGKMSFGNNFIWGENIVFSPDIGNYILKHIKAIEVLYSLCTQICACVCPQAGVHAHTHTFGCTQKSPQQYWSLWPSSLSHPATSASQPPGQGLEPSSGTCSLIPTIPFWRSSDSRE